MARIPKSGQNTGTFTNKIREQGKDRIGAGKEAFRGLVGNKAEEEIVALLQNLESDVAKMFSS